MPNLPLPKELKCQSGWKTEVLRVETVEIIPTVRAGNEWVFVIRTGNVVNVETVEATPAIDNSGDHPTARGHFGLTT
jgi:hypothetical protein